MRVQILISDELGGEEMKIDKQVSSQEDQERLIDLLKVLLVTMKGDIDA